MPLGACAFAVGSGVLSTGCEKKSLFSAWRRRVARRTGRPPPSQRAPLTAPPEASAAARAARAISSATQVRVGPTVFNNSNNYAIIFNTLNIIMHKQMEMNLQPKIPKPVVATRIATLFVRVTASDDRVLGFLNEYNLLLCSMQLFVIMEKMIKKECMIELKAHVFRATNATLMRAATERAALACLFFAPMPLRALLFNCGSSTRMRVQDRRPAVSPRSGLRMTDHGAPVGCAHQHAATRLRHRQRRPLSTATASLDYYRIPSRKGVWPA